MNIWEQSILNIIAENNNTATLQFIYSKIPSYINLSERHHLIRFNAPSYHHQVRAHIDDLLESGDVTRIERGKYSLTNKGKTRIS